MIYDYLLTAFKVIVGLITAERLIYGALLGVAFYLLWIGASLLLSFQRKFNRNCVKLYNFVKKNKLNANDANSVDFKASKISSGFSHGWKKFKSSSFGKPSDFITRREALDVEVTGGVLNQGKSFMKAFIDLSTFLLFLVNLAYLGSDNNITCYLIAESMVLPLIYFVVCKVLYFLYTSIKQQLYKSDIECLYELLDLLDSIFAKSAQVGFEMPASVSMIQGEDEIATDSGEEIEKIIDEPAVEVQPEEDPIETKEDEVEEEKEEDDIVDKYDIFKKKNIDVDKLLNEVPNKSSSLPYINVDSDYVIKDDDKETVVSKSITNLENGSELLGGMMQDMSSIRNAQKQNEPAEENKSEEEKTEEPVEENKSEENSDESIELKSLDELNVDGNAVEENSEEKQEDSTNEEVVSEPEPEEEVKLEIPDVEPLEMPEVEPEVVEEEPVQDMSEEKKENIATVVGGFKAKSKLASGGVVIERNEPISRRERVSSYEQPEDDYEEEQDDFDNRSMYQPSYQKPTVTQLSAESNADSVLNSFRNTPGGYDSYQGYNSGMQGGMYNQGYNAPQYNQTYTGFGQTYNQPVAPNYGVQGYPNVQPQQGYNAYPQQNYNNSFDSQDDDFEDVEEFEDDDIVEEKPKKAKRSKEDEPRPRNLRKKESKKVMEEITPEKKRGRPKKQVFDESVTIKNDKEFDVVLARAEKLMRKSEQGLSQSQSKRIEKELKMLMDAMNKYKEGV